MNVTSNQHALVLADTSVAARGKPQPELIPAGNAANDGEIRKRLTVIAAPADTTVVFVRSDYFSRTSAEERAFLADASYSNARTPGRDAQAESFAAARQFSERSTVGLYKENPVTLYARVQGTSTDGIKGRYIDVFA